VPHRLDAYIFQDCAPGYRSRYSDGLDGPVSIPGVARFLSSPQRRDRHWGPPSVVPDGYRFFSPGDKAAGP
jgi:hypothetical protein